MVQKIDQVDDHLSEIEVTAKEKKSPPSRLNQWLAQMGQSLKVNWDIQTKASIGPYFANRQWDLLDKRLVRNPKGELTEKGLQKQLDVFLQRLVQQKMRKENIPYLLKMVEVGANIFKSDESESALPEKSPMAILMALGEWNVIVEAMHKDIKRTVLQGKNPGEAPCFQPFFAKPFKHMSISTRPGNVLDLAAEVIMGKKILNGYGSDHQHDRYLSPLKEQYNKYSGGDYDDREGFKKIAALFQKHFKQEIDQERELEEPLSKKPWQQRLQLLAERFTLSNKEAYVWDLESTQQFTVCAEDANGPRSFQTNANLFAECVNVLLKMGLDTNNQCSKDFGELEERIDSEGSVYSYMPFVKSLMRDGHVEVLECYLNHKAQLPPAFLTAEGVCQIMMSDLNKRPYESLWNQRRCEKMFELLKTHQSDPYIHEKTWVDLAQVKPAPIYDQIMTEERVALSEIIGPIIAGWEKSIFDEISQKAAQKAKELHRNEEKSFQAKGAHDIRTESPQTPSHEGRSTRRL